MRIGLVLITALLLGACGEDSTSPGSGDDSPPPPNRALGLRNFFNGPFQATGSTERFASIHRTGVVTIEVWVDISGASRTFETICANRADDTEAGFRFGLEASDGIENRRLRLHITDENGNTVLDAQGTPGSLESGPWRHLVVASDGTQVRFSIDGTEEVVTPTVANLGSTAPAARELTVASTPTDTGSSNNLGRDLDELRIWSESRTAIQIAVFGNAPLPAGTYEDPQSGLLGYWAFDEFEALADPADATDDLRDFSGGGSHLDAPSQARLEPSEAFGDTG